MTSDDYIAWAEEYRQEADMLENVIGRKKQKLEAEKSSYKKMLLCNALKRLESQKNQCLSTAKTLEERARAIKEKEG